MAGSSEDDYNLARTASEMADYPHGVPPATGAFRPDDVAVSAPSANRRTRQSQPGSTAIASFIAPAPQVYLPSSGLARDRSIS